LVLLADYKTLNMNNVEEYLNKIDFSPYGDVKITAFELRQIMTGFEKHLASNTEIVGNVSDKIYTQKQVEHFKAIAYNQGLSDAGV